MGFTYMIPRPQLLLSDTREIKTAIDIAIGSQVHVMHTVCGATCTSNRVVLWHRDDCTHRYVLNEQLRY